jgi:hypothetical protein
MTYENRVAKYVISETTENSAGVYTCQARNDAGTAETSCQLKIQGSVLVSITYINCALSAIQGAGSPYYIG